VRPSLILATSRPTATPRSGLGIRGDLPLAWLALAVMMLWQHAYGKQGRDIEDP
jgi:hypothetical protein